MKRMPIAVTAGDRLLVLAPHPDDETLACAGLIGATLGAGAAVKVVVLTNGGNNPWPQRLLERRWRLGPADSLRWAERRCDESLCAMRILGLPARDLQFLGWPDLGVTGLLMTDPGCCVATLAAVIRNFAPTRIVLPALADTHPDHSAIAVITALAVKQLRASAQLLGFQVHGHQPRGADAGEDNVHALALDPDRHARKQAALQAYVSQLQFGKQRLLKYLAADELFVDMHPATLPFDMPLPAWGGPASAARAGVCVLSGRHAMAWCTQIHGRCMKGP